MPDQDNSLNQQNTNLKPHEGSPANSPEGNTQPSPSTNPTNSAGTDSSLPPTIDDNTPPPAVSDDGSIAPPPPIIESAEGTPAPPPTESPQTENTETPDTAGNQEADIPPVVTAGGSGRKKNFGRKKVVATILGILLLVGGVGAGVVLVQQQQDIRERAKVIGECKFDTDCPSGYYCKYGGPITYCEKKATPEPVPKCDKEGMCKDENYKWITDKATGQCALEYDPATCKEEPPPEPPPPPPPGKTTCKLIGPELCVGNNPTGDCYQGGQGNQYACYKLKGNPGKEIEGTTNCSCPEPYTWGPRQEYGKWWCFNTADTTCSPDVVAGKNTGEMCSLQPEKCPSKTTPPPPPPSPSGISAQCLNIQVFDTEWNKISDLSTLKAGDTIRLTVAGTTTSGSFDKARFIINGTTRAAVTQKRPGTNEFYDEYTIPEGVTTFTINAQLHHTSLGWF